jgi:hypothetical protein
MAWAIRARTAYGDIIAERILYGAVQIWDRMIGAGAFVIPMAVTAGAAICGYVVAAAGILACRVHYLISWHVDVPYYATAGSLDNFN